MKDLGIDIHNQMLLATQRYAELIHEAEQYRLAHSEEPGDHLSIRLIHRIRAPFGGVGSAFSGVEEPCDEPCTDCLVPC